MAGSKKPGYWGPSLFPGIYISLIVVLCRDRRTGLNFSITLVQRLSSFRRFDHVWRYLYLAHIWKLYHNLVRAALGCILTRNEVCDSTCPSCLPPQGARILAIRRWAVSFRTPSSSQLFMSDSDSDGADSLFGEPSTMTMPVALRRVPPIPGLFVPPIFISPELATRTVRECMRLYFNDTDVNQIMLFGRSTTAVDREEEDIDARMGRGLPSILIQLLHQLSALLQPWIPDDLHSHLFPPKGAPSRARQAILNLYHPGEGITPHVDLLNRFDDGIIGVSLCGNCVMSFEEVENAVRGSEEPRGDGKRWDLYLLERSVLVMSKDARYRWKHGIPERTHDLVENENECHEPCLIRRGIRLSVTFRWLLPGADIVGGPEA